LGTRKEAGLAWSAAMSVGVSALDTDHKCLIRIINLLGNVVSDEDAEQAMEMVVDTLIVYGRFHFAREERLMAAAGFPGAPFHCAEHHGFVHHIRRLRDSCAKPATPKMCQELWEYLIDWLCHHILIQDMAYKPYMINMAGAEQMAQAVAPPLPMTDRERILSEV
jgi:hemerythrin-like metal-binding protein